MANLINTSVVDQVAATGAFDVTLSGSVVADNDYTNSSQNVTFNSTLATSITFGDYTLLLDLCNQWKRALVVGFGLSLVPKTRNVATITKTNTQVKLLFTVAGATIEDLTWTQSTGLVANAASSAHTITFSDFVYLLSVRAQFVAEIKDF